MLKILIRKQLLDTFSFAAKNRKTGKMRDTAGTLIHLILLGLIIYVAGRLFYKLSADYVAFLGMSDFAWLLFAALGLIATGVAIAGSIFSSYSELYQARDNEFLLSMPIKPGVIVASRIIGCYVLCLMLEAIIIMPAFIALWKNGSIGFLVAAMEILSLLIYPVVALLVSSLFGWIIGTINTKLSSRWRNLSILVLSMALVLLYILFFSKAVKTLMGATGGRKIFTYLFKTILYPAKLFGEACAGEWKSFLLLLLICIVATVIMFMLVSATFNRIETASRGVGGKTFKEKKLKNSSASGALLKKEFLRYKSSNAYLFRSSLGTILMIVLIIAALFRWDSLRDTAANVATLGSDRFVAIAGAWLCFMIGLNTQSASSLSLEGKNLWILETLPVDGRTILAGKLKFHVYVNFIPVLICDILLILLLKPGTKGSMLLILGTLAFLGLCAGLGLLADMIFPKYDWVSESKAVKHSASTAISRFGSWALLAAAFAIYHKLPEGWLLSHYFMIVIVAAFFLDAVLILLIKSRSRSVFMKA